MPSRSRCSDSAVLIRTTARGGAGGPARGARRAARRRRAPTVRPAPAARATDIDRLVEASRAAGVRVDVSTMEVGRRCPTPLARTAYRVVQEGLTNVHKHARGRGDDASRSPATRRAGVTVEVANQRPVAGRRAAARAPAPGWSVCASGSRWSAARSRPGRAPTAAGASPAWLPWPLRDGGPPSARRPPGRSTT